MNADQPGHLQSPVDDARHVQFVWSVPALNDYRQYVVAPFFSWSRSAFLVAYLLGLIPTTAASLLVLKPWSMTSLAILAISTSVALHVLVSWLSFASRKADGEITVDDPRKVGATWVRIDHYGVTVATDVSSDFLSWLGVKKIEIYAKAIFFRTGATGGVYVPRYAFDSDTDLEDFCVAAQRYRKEKRPPLHLTSGEDLEPDQPMRLN